MSVCLFAARYSMCMLVLHSRVHIVVSEIGVDKCFEPTTNAHAWLMPRMLCSVIVGSGASLLYCGAAGISLWQNGQIGRHKQMHSGF